MFIFIFVLTLFFYSSNLFGYVGLGPLIPIIGNALIFLFFAFVSIIGVFFYPIKKMIEFRKKNLKKNNEDKKNK
jgi:hypothetical protein